MRHGQSLLVLVLGLFLSGCTSWFFFPSQAQFGDPAEAGVRYRDVYLPVTDVITVHGWLLEPDRDGVSVGGSAQEPVGSVYFLHGNAENISSHSRAIYWLVKAGYEVFALDYRGYGLSEGKPDLPEVFEDIDAGARWLLEHRESRAADTPVYLLGQSLGASLAISYAASDRAQAQMFEAIIVEAAFTAYGKIAGEVASRNWLTWLFQWPAQWLLTGPFDPIDAIAQLAPVPVLVIHSQDDGIIPFSHGEQLFDSAREPRQFIATTGPHISAFANGEVRDQVLKFMSGIH